MLYTILVETFDIRYFLLGESPSTSFRIRN